MVALYRAEPEAGTRELVGAFPADIIHQAAEQAGLEAYEIEALTEDAEADPAAA